MQVGNRTPRQLLAPVSNHERQPKVTGQLRTEALKGRDQKKAVEKSNWEETACTREKEKKDKHALTSSTKYAKATGPANPQAAVHILLQAHSESKQSSWKLKISWEKQTNESTEGLEDKVGETS